MKKIYSFILITVFSSTVFGQTIPSYVPTNGLVGWWPFNGNANDESGNGNNGTVNGATLTADRFGNANKAYSFDGVNDNVIISNSPLISNSNEISLSTWVNFSGVLNAWPNHQIIFLNSENSTSQGAGFILRILANDTLQFEVGDGIIAPTAKIRYPYSAFHKVWKNIVCTYDSLTMRLFIDGQFIASNSISINLKNTLTAYSLGNYHTLVNNFQWYNGKLDDIGIWNRALTQQEITALYTSNGVGIKDPSQNTLSVYPNPAKTQITLNTTTNQIGKSLKVYDALGKVVYETILKQQQCNINIAHWANGIYTVAIPEQNLTYKFVKE